jgi:hypothetical protein
MENEKRNAKLILPMSLFAVCEAMAIITFILFKIVR